MSGNATEHPAAKHHHATSGLPPGKPQSVKEVFDPLYNVRWASRNRQKTEAVLRAAGEHAGRVLDIGCNAGYVAEALLTSGHATAAAGIELEAGVVSPTLVANPAFRLFTGSVTDYPFAETFDTVIYNAVHHHVLGLFGPGVAMRIWQAVVSHCDRTLVFETGVLEERGDHYWKPPIADRFKTTARYLDHLLAAIGPRLRQVEVIARLRIHGTDRPVYRISLHPLGSRYDLAGDPAAFYGDLWKADTPWEVMDRWHRTMKSRAQELVAVGGERGRTVYEETDFFRLRHPATGQIAFAKRSNHHPYRDMRECLIHRSITHPRIVHPIEVSPAFGLVFPFLDWAPLGQAVIADAASRRRLREDLDAFFDVVTRTPVRTGLLDLEPGAEDRERPLIGLVDLHPNNFMVRLDGGRVAEWAVVDMEYYSNRNAARNERHRRSLHWLLKGGPGWCPWWRLWRDWLPGGEGST